MSNKKPILIYNWEGIFSPFVAGYAYFIVDQLQNHDELKQYLKHHSGHWLLYKISPKHPVLDNILHTIDHLTFGDKMQLVRFVSTYKEKLLLPHNNCVSIPNILHVKM